MKVSKLNEAMKQVWTEIGLPGNPYRAIPSHRLGPAYGVEGDDFNLLYYTAIAAGEEMEKVLPNNSFYGCRAVYAEWKAEFHSRVCLLAGEPVRGTDNVRGKCIGISVR